jgi:hypothetical protein
LSSSETPKRTLSSVSLAESPVFGRAFVDDANSHHQGQATKAPADQHDGMAGSVMLYRYPTIEDCWARIKGDAYWTDDVWDKERVVVREIIGAEGDNFLKLVQDQPKF